MQKRVLGVLAGCDMPAEQLLVWARSAEVVLAADGGADRLLGAGVRPSKIVGDLDSASEAARQDAELVRVEDQGSTDCDKLLALAASLGYSEITLACVEGDLLDHVLGTICSALQASIGVRFALRRGIAWLLCGRTATVRTARNRRVSLMPLTECHGVDLEGVRWPLRGADLSPLGLVSISNRASTHRIRASVPEGAALLVVEYPSTELPVW